MSLSKQIFYITSLCITKVNNQCCRGLLLLIIIILLVEFISNKKNVHRIIEFTAIINVSKCIKILSMK